MTTRVTSFLLALALSLVVIPAAVAGTTSGTITSATSSDNCYEGEGTCSGTATAGPDGTFSGSVELTNPDSPFNSGNRYSQALAWYTLGFDLAAPAETVEIAVDLHLDDASAAWAQSGMELFGGSNSPSSGAKVLLQLFGKEGPVGCGCGFVTQGAPSLTVVSAGAPGASDSVSNTDVTLSMVAEHADPARTLPAGHYELNLRAYALADLGGSGDWGTLTASLGGTIEAVTITVPTVDEIGGSALALSVSGSGSNRTLVATLTDAASGAGLSERTITFSTGTTTLGTATTDGAGVATLPLSGRYRGGSHPFTAAFAGDDSYLGASAETRS